MRGKIAGSAVNRVWLQVRENVEYSLWGSPVVWERVKVGVWNSVHRQVGDQSWAKALYAIKVVKLGYEIKESRW